MDLRRVAIALVVLAAALVLTLHGGGSGDAAPWADLRTSAPSGVALIIRPEDPLTRLADLRLVQRVLPISAVVVVSNTEMTRSDSVRIREIFGTQPVRFLRTINDASLQRLGLDVTPGVFVWNTVNHMSTVMSVQKDRHKLQDQLRRIQYLTALDGLTW
ncbi:MAG TPA: hypothetical protein DGD08_16200 [Gemmatimonas aurantiaca]|uniref:Uncharacterized protein n=2 Tax=Gemmatimonas aurantiaca TaxID=173480 RepID=C1A653_GEMAT|nr:hypothetical protein [Gemmatimonas aurantiaca]BAH37713.1 hypothetical protein GAU_0671 [Gemmatimonas aurantiaca T-27]HCT58748.1 hypothetical protein [Gemmatimonas aurantiaca]